MKRFLLYQLSYRQFLAVPRGIEPRHTAFQTIVLTSLHQRTKEQGCQDSNLKQLSQSQLCYHYTTPQQFSNRGLLDCTLHAVRMH